MRCASRGQLRGWGVCSTVTMSCSHHHCLLRNVIIVPERNRRPTVVSQHRRSSVRQARLSEARPASDVAFKSHGWPYTVACRELRNEAMHRTPVCEAGGTGWSTRDGASLGCPLRIQDRRGNLDSLQLARRGRGAWVDAWSIPLCYDKTALDVAPAPGRLAAPWEWQLLAACR